MFWKTPKACRGFSQQEWATPFWTCSFVLLLPSLLNLLHPICKPWKSWQRVVLISHSSPAFSFPVFAPQFQEDVPHLSGENLRNGSYGRLYALNGLCTSGWQEISVSVLAFDFPLSSPFPVLEPNGCLSLPLNINTQVLAAILKWPSQPIGLF